MKNITILHGEKPNYWVVRADHERFTNEILYEGNKFHQCLDYIKRENGEKKWIAIIVDPWDKGKTWKIAHYSCGHYTMSEFICGNKWQKTPET